MVDGGGSEVRDGGAENALECGSKGSVPEANTLVEPLLVDG